MVLRGAQSRRRLVSPTAPYPSLISGFEHCRGVAIPSHSPFTVASHIKTMPAQRIYDQQHAFDPATTRQYRDNHIEYAFTGYFHE
jgi:hypothetical protein